MSPVPKTRLRVSPYWIIAICGSLLAAVLIALTHSHEAIISFDEGFHGGGAIFVREMLRHVLHLDGDAHRPTYLIGEFSNGITLYPPLWIGAAGFLGFVFGATTEVFRAASLLFYVTAVLFAFWFVSRARPGTPQDAQRAGLVAVAILGTVPMVVIYAHLMMLEVSLMLGVSAIVGCCYLYAMDLLPRRPGVIVVLLLVCAAGALTKLAAFEVAWAIVVSFAVIASLLFWRQKFYRHFLKPELLMFAAASGLAIYGYIHIVKRYLGVDMVGFYVGQSQQGASTSHLAYAVGLLVKNWDFYLKDFRHIPVISAVWFGSVLLYALWRRTPLSVLLLVWAGATYAAFTAVSPQVPQYIMPIYAPLALATGLLLYDLAALVKPQRLASPVATVLTGVLMIAQIAALTHSESSGWRFKENGIESAAAVLSERAQAGDRVMVWHDGTTYAVRAAGLVKNIQVYNSVTQQCTLAMVDSFEWALTVSEPPTASVVDMGILSVSPWEVVGRFGPDNSTVLYRNTATTWPLTVEPERYKADHSVADPTASAGAALLLDGQESQPSFWGCYREMRLGSHEVAFRLRAQALPADIPDSQDVVRLEYAGYPNGEYASRSVTAGQLRQAASWTEYSFSIDHEKLDKPGELKASVLVPATVLLDKVTVK